MTRDDLKDLVAERAALMIEHKALDGRLEELKNNFEKDVEQIRLKYQGIEDELRAPLVAKAHGINAKIESVLGIKMDDKIDPIQIAQLCLKAVEMVKAES
jgi:hypothetical protein